jgi:hypothetical protein
MLKGLLGSLGDRRNRIAVAVAAAVVAIAFFAIFWGVLRFVVLGFGLALVAMAALVVAVLALAKIHYKRPLKALFAEKKRLLAAIDIAQKQYLRRKLSEADFNGIFKERQRRLIEVEALIDELYNSEKKDRIDEGLLAVQSKKRHILKELLDEKRRVVKEIDLAEKSYLKRKIDASTYKALVEKNQQALVDLEANIRGLYDEANASKVMLDLKERLSELKSTEREGKKKKAKSEREEIVDIAGEIADQVSKASKAQKK